MSAFGFYILNACPSFFLLYEPDTDTPAVREVNASCCRPDLDVKCAVGCSLTVNVPVVPLALHSPVGQELEVMSAIHAVQASHPPVVPQQVAGHSLILGYQHLSVRHPAPTAVAPTGGLAEEPGCLCENNNPLVSPCGGQVFTCSWTSAEIKQEGCASPTPGLNQQLGWNNGLEWSPRP